MKGAFMRELVAYVICAIVVLYGIRESIGTAFEERTLKYSLYKVLYYLLRFVPLPRFSIGILF